MPLVLVFAFAASLGVHGLVLFGADIDWPMAAADPPPLVVEIQPAPPVQPVLVTVASSTKTPAKPVAHKRRPPVRRPSSALQSTPQEAIRSEPEAAPEQNAMIGAEAEAQAVEAGDSAPAGEKMTEPGHGLPARGRIEYRVDRGDQGFVIGRSLQQWELADGHYRIVAHTETTGLVGLFKPLRIEAESRGMMTAEGFRPERFSTRQKDGERQELAELDWEQKLLRLRNRPQQDLPVGTQDLLSFNYQLGLMTDLATGTRLPIVTGKKLATYRLEVVGDEQIETPAGTFLCLHVRVPGVAATELWLAHDRFLLPVRVLYTDHRGDLYLQVATRIEFDETP